MSGKHECGCGESHENEDDIMGACVDCGRKVCIICAVACLRCMNFLCPGCAEKYGVFEDDDGLPSTDKCSECKNKE
jgi:hypothetical protein